ncbi:MAG: hypothetical protein PWQ16_85 [bacterium]|nr:hypothetical protein [bacterium]
MRRKGWLMVFACMLVLLVATGLVYAQEKVYTFTGQSRMPSGNVFYESLVRACKNAEAASGGRLVFKIYPAGAISPATKELDGVHRGVLDFADTCYMYYRDRWPAAPIFTAKPAGMSPSEALLWVLEGGGHELIVEMLKDYNVQILRGAGQLAPPEIFLVTNKPLKSVADLKGMRIRSAGDGAAILDRLGAACTLMPVGEVFEAMHRGVIDAYEAASPAVNWTMGLQEAGKYIYLSPVRHPYEWNPFFFNKKKWEQIPKDLQRIIESAWTEEAFIYYAKAIKADLEALDKFRKAGVQVLQLPKEIEDAFIAEADKYYAEQAKKDPFTAKVLESYNGFREKFRSTWQRP